MDPDHPGQFVEDYPTFPTYDEELDAENGWMFGLHRGKDHVYDDNAGTIDPSLLMMPEVQSTPQMTQIQNLDEVPQLASSYSVFDDPIREQVCENWQQTIVPSIESDEVQKEYLKTYLDESPPLDVVGNSVPESRICHEPTDHGLTTGESEYLINRAARKHNAARAEKSKELAQAKTFYPHENFTDLHFSSDRLVVDDNDIDSVLESFYGGADPLSKNPEKDTMQQQRTAEESDRAHLGAEKKALKNLARTRGLK